MLQQNLVMQRLLECIANVLREKLQEGLQKNSKIGGEMPGRLSRCFTGRWNETDFVRQRSNGSSRFGVSRRPVEGRGRSGGRSRF